MAKIFSNSFVQPVYYLVRKSDNQQLVKRAPFDVVKINGMAFIQPRSIGLPDQALNAFNLGSVEDQNNWRDADMGGYEILDPIVLNENQLGDGADNWIGLHSISII